MGVKRWLDPNTVSLYQFKDARQCSVTTHVNVHWRSSSKFPARGEASHTESSLCGQRGDLVLLQHEGQRVEAGQQ